MDEIFSIDFLGTHYKFSAAEIHAALDKIARAQLVETDEQEAALLVAERVVKDPDAAEELRAEFADRFPLT